MQGPMSAVLLAPFRLWMKTPFTFGPVIQTKVPLRITIFFWIIKILCTTIGESAADYLADTVGLGLPKTTLIMMGILIVSFLFQFSCNRYIPVVYWLLVIFVSVFGTNVTDNLADGAGVPVWSTIILWSGCLAISFGIWYYCERTLSIHSIYTRKREAFYWAVILFTFALGTGTGDFIAEACKLGYWESVVLWAGVMGLTALVYYVRVFKLNAVLAFWIAYIFSRPMGASIGDFLASPKKDGGLGLGPGITSAIFLAVIVIIVIFLTVTKLDRRSDKVTASDSEPPVEKFTDPESAESSADLKAKAAEKEASESCAPEVPV